MAKIKQSPKLPPEERRLQLLSSAATLFSKKGFQLTTTEQIARNAGVTKGALYFHFKSKEDIFFELVKKVVSHYQITLVENMDNIKSPGDFVRLFLQPDLLVPEDDPLSANLDFWVQAITIPRIKRYMNNHFKEMVALTITCLAPDYGSSKKEREQIAMILFSYLDGMMVRLIMHPEMIDMKMHIKIFDKLFENIKNKRRQR